MEKEEYEAAQGLLISNSAMISMLPLEEMLSAIDRAETVGPIVDPTLYRKGADNMGNIKRIAKAALVLKKEVIKIRGELEDGGK